MIFCLQSFWLLFQKEMDFFCWFKIMTWCKYKFKKWNSLLVFKIFVCKVILRVTAVNDCFLSFEEQLNGQDGRLGVFLLGVYLDLSALCFCLNLFSHCSTQTVVWPHCLQQLILVLWMITENTTCGFGMEEEVSHHLVYRVCWLMMSLCGQVQVCTS